MERVLKFMLFIFLGVWFSTSGHYGTATIAKEKHKDLLNVSHRGASGYAPEHTIVAYEMGEKLHGDSIEIDLQMTRDGVLIAMHDETVNRTTNGIGRVKDLHLKEIKQLDAGSWFNETYPQYAKAEYKGIQVPTLEEVFQTFGKNRAYYIETKAPHIYPGMEEELVRLIDQYKINKDKLLVQSFSPESLIQMRALDSDIQLVQLLSYKATASISDEEIADIKRYAVGIGPNHTFLTKDYVQKVIHNDLELHPYTVNEKERMKLLIDWGVTGMFTNFPDRLHEVKKGK